MELEDIILITEEFINELRALHLGQELTCEQFYTIARSQYLTYMGCIEDLVYKEDQSGNVVLDQVLILTPQGLKVVNKSAAVNFDNYISLLEKSACCGNRVSLSIDPNKEIKIFRILPGGCC